MILTIIFTLSCKGIRVNLMDYIGAPSGVTYSGIKRVQLGRDPNFSSQDFWGAYRMDLEFYNNTLEKMYEKMKETA